MKTARIVGSHEMWLGRLAARRTRKWHIGPSPKAVAEYLPWCHNFADTTCDIAVNWLGHGLQSPSAATKEEIGKGVVG
jgi:hypothetical protein